LSSSVLEEAGCVTVAAQDDADGVRAAFGAEDEPIPGSSAVFAGDWVAEQQSDWAWFTTTPGPSGAVVVVEDDEFQGSRPEVLRVLSRASAFEKAASLFCNVNGMVSSPVPAAARSSAPSTCRPSTRQTPW
jgi:hypothetical protein